MGDNFSPENFVKTVRRIETETILKENLQTNLEFIEDGLENITIAIEIGVANNEETASRELIRAWLFNVKLDILIAMKRNNQE